MSSLVRQGTLQLEAISDFPDLTDALETKAQNVINSLVQVRACAVHAYFFCSDCLRVGGRQAVGSSRFREEDQFKNARENLIASLMSAKGELMKRNENQVSSFPLTCTIVFGALFTRHRP